jgi:hypothetical protein
MFDELSAAWDTVKALHFYLPEEQWRDMNEARAAFGEWHQANDESSDD